MNRRGFLGAMLKAGVGAMILPPAVTYARQWKPTASGILVAAIDGGVYNCHDYLGKWFFVENGIEKSIIADLPPVTSFRGPIEHRRDFVKTFFSPNTFD